MEYWSDVRPNSFSRPPVFALLLGCQLYLAGGLRWVDLPNVCSVEVSQEVQDPATGLLTGKSLIDENYRRLSTYDDPHIQLSQQLLLCLRVRPVRRSVLVRVGLVRNHLDPLFSSFCIAVQAKSRQHIEAFLHAATGTRR